MSSKEFGAEATVSIQGTIEADVRIRGRVTVEEGGASLVGDPEVRFNEEWRSAYEWDLPASDIERVGEILCDAALEDDRDASAERCCA